MAPEQLLLLRGLFENFFEGKILPFVKETRLKGNIYLGQMYGPVARSDACRQIVTLILTKEGIS